MAINLGPVIISLLEEAATPLATLDIAKRAGLTTTKEVNPTLYTLLNAKQVTKICDKDGAHPRWQLSEHYKIQGRIIQLLNETPEAFAVKEIKARLNLDMTRSEINTILYSLLKRNLVTKTANPDGTQPRWKI